MSITKNVFTLKKAYDLIVANQWKQYEDIESGSLFVWGPQTDGLFGINNNNCFNPFIPAAVCGSSSPIQIPGSSWKCLTADINTIWATKSDGTFWAWGLGSDGVLANSSTVNRSSPSQIPGTDWTNISVASALKRNGTLWVWGLNCGGGLGQNQSTNYNAVRSSPIQIPGTAWCEIRSGCPIFGLRHGLKTDGTLWSWGCGFQGHIGNSSSVARSSPTQVPGTQWAGLFASPRSSTVFATKTDGTLWVWGANYCNAFGTSAAAQNGCFSSPIQVPGNQWLCVNVGCEHNRALKTDGTLWTWGRDFAGSFGQGVECNTTLNSPLQIPGSWVSVDVTVRGSSQDAMYARKSDNSLWAWGFEGSCGRLLRTCTPPGSSSVCSPIQISGTSNWLCVTGTGLSIFGIRKN